MAAFGVAAWLIWRQIHTVSPAQIEGALATIPLWGVGAALVLTAVSYGCLAISETILGEALGLRLDRRRVVLTSVCAFVASNTLGLSLASGGAVRLRGYGPAGLTHGQIARLTLLVSTAVSLSGVVTAGVIIMAAPLIFARLLDRPVALIEGLGLMFAAPAVLWFLAFRRQGVRWLGGGGESRLTRRKRTFALGAGLADWVTSGAALFVLLPHPTPTAFVVFLVVFIVGSLVSAASGVPGGLGVFEAVVISLTPLVAQTHETAAALLVYRLIYSFGPALIVLAAIAIIRADHRLGPVTRRRRR